MTERPDYLLFSNNCQNFAKYLIEVLCPDALLPDTIRDILEHLFNPTPLQWRYRLDLDLPGAYPISITSSSIETRTFESASSDLWMSATQSPRSSIKARFSIGSGRPSMDTYYDALTSSPTSTKLFFVKLSD